MCEFFLSSYTLNSDFVYIKKRNTKIKYSLNEKHTLLRISGESPSSKLPSAIPQCRITLSLNLPGESFSHTYICLYFSKAEIEATWFYNLLFNERWLAAKFSASCYLLLIYCLAWSDQFPNSKIYFREQDLSVLLSSKFSPSILSLANCFLHNYHQLKCSSYIFHIS